jgi:hypothetical protein
MSAMEGGDSSTDHVKGLTLPPGVKTATRLLRSIHLKTMPDQMAINMPFGKTHDRHFYKFLCRVGGAKARRLIRCMVGLTNFINI